MGSGWRRRVGSRRVNVSAGRVGSKKSDSWTTLDFVASQGNSSDNGMPSQFAAFGHPPRLVPVIKRIPKSARKVCAQLLSLLISDVVCNVDSAEKWNNLMNFSTQILLKPKRGGKRRNLCKLISDRVSKWPRGLVEEKSTAGCKVASRNLSGDQILAKAVMAKIEDGNIRAAVRIICSDDAQASDSPETRGALIDKHLPAPTVCHIPPKVTDGSVPALQVDEGDVRRAINSFPLGSSCGPDSLFPAAS